MGIGTITVEELREALRSGVNAKLPQSEIEALLQDVDMNASGAIDYEEFLAATLHASKIATDEHLQRAFQELDRDGSGVGLCSG
jgi:calcium-dependent protein kinase